MAERAAEEITAEKTARDLMLEEYRQRILDLLKPEQTAGIPAAAKFDRRGRKARDMERPIGAVNPDGGRPGSGGSGGNNLRNPSKGGQKEGKNGGSALTPTLPSPKEFDLPPKSGPN